MNNLIIYNNCSSKSHDFQFIQDLKGHSLSLDEYKGMSATAIARIQRLFDSYGQHASATIALHDKIKTELSEKLVVQECEAVNDVNDERDAWLAGDEAVQPRGGEQKVTEQMEGMNHDIEEFEDELGIIMSVSEKFKARNRIEASEEAIKGRKSLEPSERSIKEEVTEFLQKHVLKPLQTQEGRKEIWKKGKKKVKEKGTEAVVDAIAKIVTTEVDKAFPGREARKRVGSTIQQIGPGAVEIVTVKATYQVLKIQEKIGYFNVSEKKLSRARDAVKIEETRDLLFTQAGKFIKEPTAQAYQWGKKAIEDLETSLADPCN